jgi:hypothetical protein
MSLLLTKRISYVRYKFQACYEEVDWTLNLTCYKYLQITMQELHLATKIYPKMSKVVS